MNYSDFFSEELEKLKNQGLYRKFRQINRNKNSFPEAIEICDSSRRKIEIWCTNDYLNMSRHPQVLEAAVKVIREYGTGSGGTRNISGTTSYHVDLENELASFHQKESALLFSSAYTANQSSLWVLCKKIKDITVYSDELNHASLIQGIKTSGAKCKIFRHNDLEHLEELLRQEPLYSPKLIVFESLYSMEGIYSPMKGIINLAKKYGSLTYLDEVHSVGLYGPEGRGIAAEQGVSDQIDIINATLSKAFGQFGGYIAARRELIDFVRCFSPGFIFTTSLVPAIAAASLESIQIVKTANESRTNDIYLIAYSLFCSDTSSFWAVKTHRMNLIQISQRAIFFGKIDNPFHRRVNSLHRIK